MTECQCGRMPKCALQPLMVAACPSKINKHYNLFIQDNLEPSYKKAKI
jgi:hypothetical protein